MIAFVHEISIVTLTTNKTCFFLIIAPLYKPLILDVTCNNLYNFKDIQERFKTMTNSKHADNDD